MSAAVVLPIALLSCGSPGKVARDASKAAPAPAALSVEPGFATDPAVSADGRWLASASDRGGQGFLHLWVRPFAGGEARQLTAGSNDDHAPVFSPDGSMLAYRGEANGGGIYLVTVATGQA
ncbi:MAG: hypothetical protein ABIZ80_24580, partial [Bryobacteraceae bacterium]